MIYRCISAYHDARSDGRSVVGIKKDQDGYSIKTPYGLLFDSIIEKKGNPQEFKQLKIYAKSIQKALNSQRVKSKIELLGEGEGNPISAINIVMDYIKNGSYREFLQKYIIDSNGKIDFKRTCAKIKPFINNNEMFFQSYVIRKSIIIDEEIVSIAQCNVINHFMENGGEILFGSKFVIPTKKVKLNKALVVKLKRTLSQCFNSRKQQLINWIINYVSSVEVMEKNKGDWQFMMIASTLWEEIVEWNYGNQILRNKTVYGKKYEMIDALGNIITGNSTQHDTVYEDDDMIMIIDAKMYKDERSLLSEEVLGKQFGYYKEAKIKNPSKKILNFLILPSIVENGETEGFLPTFIIDPHNEEGEKDPHNIIFVYKADFRKILNNYYYGIKISGNFIKAFQEHIEQSEINEVLRERGYFQSTSQS